MWKSVLVVLIVLTHFQVRSDRAFDGFKVYDIHVKNEHELKLLTNLKTSEGKKRDLDFFSLHFNVQDKVKIMVKPSEQKFVEDFFTKNGLDVEVIADDVIRSLTTTQYFNDFSGKNRDSGEITFFKYHTYEEINKYLDKLGTSNENVQVKLVGRSYEGRDIKTVTITNGDGKRKNSVLIDAGIHAREWIAPATALYLIQELTTENSNMSKLLDKVDFVFHPLVNPDGYDFSFKTFRFWRKTRSRQSEFCTGVDANRNYDFHWNEVGSSDFECDQDYHGPRAFSEIESKISGNLMKELAGNCKFFLTFHSCGNLLLYPYSYTSENPENVQDNDDVARAGQEAILATTGTNYKVGGVKILYLASGTSIDYAHSVANIPIAIVMELPCGGTFGFDLPQREIKRVVKETAIGVYAMVEKVYEKFPN